MTALSDAIDRLAAAVPNGELMVATDPAALLDEAARLISAAEQRGYARGLREGREEERADVLPSASECIALSAVIALAGLDASDGDLRMVDGWLARVDAAISRRAHVPTPQGDEPSRSQARRLAVQRGESEPCPDCAGESGGNRGE